MRQKSVNGLNVGDILGRTIFSSEGRVLLGGGVALTSSYITRLRELGLSIIYIDDEESKDIVIEDVISEEHRREAMVSLEQSSQAIRIGKDFSGFEVKKNINNIIEDILNQKEIFISLMDMRSLDSQVYSHSVNVCVLATVLGKALQMNRENLETLAIGALLHDIGTVKLPKELVVKRTKFSVQEAALYKKHTEQGFEILRSKRELNLVSAHIALQHHEWLNGNGYPRNLGGNAIHSMAQIVGIVDFYDNLVNDGPGHSRIQPNEACEILMGSANMLFSHELVTTFLKYVAAYPTGSTVMLNTGEVGIVVDQNKSLPMRPIVRVLKDASNLEQISAKEYNLVEDLTTFIKDIVQ
jgi:uncharacterized domain HDIG